MPTNTVLNKLTGKRKRYEEQTQHSQVQTCSPEQSAHKRLRTDERSFCSVVHNSDKKESHAPTDLLPHDCLCFRRLSYDLILHILDFVSFKCNYFAMNFDTVVDVHHQYLNSASIQQQLGTDPTLSSQPSPQKKRNASELISHIYGYFRLDPFRKIFLLYRNMTLSFGKQYEEDNRLTDTRMKMFIPRHSIKSIDVSANNLGREFLEHISEAKSLVKLDLSANLDVTCDSVRAVASNHPQLQELSLNATSVGPKGICDVKNLRQLRRLRMSMLIGETLNQESIQALSSHPSLTHLQLYLNKISDVGASCLLSNARLKKLYLGFNGLTDVAFNHIQHHPNMSLNVLDLTHNAIGDVGAKMIARYMQGLGELHLSSSLVTDVGVNDLICLSDTIKFLDIHFSPALTAECLRNLSKNKTLQRLVVSKNLLGNQAAIYASQNNTLESLEMNECGIDDHGAMHLFQNVNFRVLELAKNMITDKSVKHIPVKKISSLQCLELSENIGITFVSCRHLAKHPSLTVLNLQNTSLKNGNAKYLFCNRNFTSLNLSGNQLTDKSLSTLLDNTTLVHLNLESNQISDEGACSIYTKNRQLRSLNLTDNDKLTWKSVKCAIATSSIISLTCSFRNAHGKKLCVEQCGRFIH
ncbi:hypothetical protein AKO1_001273 [Acrasis kona]|uniref:Uncharacterized protein n=1 Tax=Acrasis kona TaxID=1008807 RepID=A0AAW2ZAU4_9EUKA